jgi:DNA-binding transcriptional ArsR family regulator
VHDDGEPERRPAYLEAVASGALPPGYGVGDGVGLLFRGTRLAEVVASRPGARAYRVTAADGAAREHELEPRVLARGGDDLPGAVPHDIGELRLLHAARRTMRGRWLDVFLYGYMLRHMARAATTADAFNAVAEPRRRQILDVLAGGERPVNDLVATLGLNQPQVSKHLRVLREVGAVDVRGDGRQRLYRLNGHALKPIHDWVKGYERSWDERFGRLDVVLEDLKQKEQGDDGRDE